MMRQRGEISPPTQPRVGLSAKARRNRSKVSTPKGKVTLSLNILRSVAREYAAALHLLDPHRDGFAYQWALLDAFTTEVGKIPMAKILVRGAGR